MEELRELLAELEAKSRRVVELLCEREIVVELATNQSILHELHPRFEMMIQVGQAVSRREAEIAQVARSFDAVIDPATIPVVD